MALFMDTPGRERNPLGGYAADGFGQWLLVTTHTTREARDVMRGRVDPTNAMHSLATSAARHYNEVLSEWQNVRDDMARDRFEVSLITKVMSAYSAAEYARTHGVTQDGRPMTDVTGEYLRACIILGKYVGVSEITVAACQDDQGAFLALRNTRKG